MSVPMVRLGDVCTRISDGTHQAPKWADNGIPFIFVSNIRNGRISFETNKFVSNEEYKKLTKNCPIDAGDVLYTAVGSYGNSAVVPKDRTFIFQRHIAHLKPQHELVDSTYLAQMLETPAVRRQADKLARGVAQKTVTLTSLRDFEIPLPSLDEQKRIAAILDKADALRAKRRQAIALLDSLTQSIFLEMFGDPVSNPKGWDEKFVLSELADIGSGITKGRPTRGQATRAVPYLAVANVQDRALKLAAVKEIQATDDEIARYRLLKDDLLVTEGGDPDKLGRGTLWSDELPEAIHQNHIFRIRFTDDRILPLFANWLLGSERGKKYFLRSAKQTTGIASINKTQLSNFPVLLPPIDLQIDFTEKSRNVALMQTKLKAKSRLLNDLFASLQHRAFSGQL